MEGISVEKCFPNFVIFTLCIIIFFGKIHWINNLDQVTIVYFIDQNFCKKHKALSCYLAYFREWKLLSSSLLLAKIVSVHIVKVKPTKWFIFLWIISSIKELGPGAFFLNVKCVSNAVTILWNSNISLKIINTVIYQVLMILDRYISIL